MKRVLTLIIAGIMIIGSVTILQGQDYDRHRDQRYKPYVSVEIGRRHDRYDNRDHHWHSKYDRYYRNERHLSRYERGILKDLRQNERRIYRYEQKIRELRHRARYSGNYRYYQKSIQHYRHKIYQLERENAHLERKLRKHDRRDYRDRRNYRDRRDHRDHRYYRH